MCKKGLKDYVPRHLRLGVCAVTPEIVGYHDVVEDVPVVDGKKVVYTEPLSRRVPVSETMAKYKLEAFSLSALVEAGVPLDVVNINHSKSFTIDQLESICKEIDGAEKFVQKVLDERSEREKWFKFEETLNVSDVTDNVVPTV